MDNTTTRIPAKAVCNRFGGIAPVTLWRWLRDPGMKFPKPTVINRRRYFDLAEIERWERARAVRSDV